MSINVIETLLLPNAAGYLNLFFGFGIDRLKTAEDAFLIPYVDESPKSQVERSEAVSQLLQPLAKQRFEQVLDVPSVGSGVFKIADGAISLDMTFTEQYYSVIQPAIDSFGPLGALFSDDRTLSQTTSVAEVAELSAAAMEMIIDAYNFHLYLMLLTMDKIIRGLIKVAEKRDIELPSLFVDYTLDDFIVVKDAHLDIIEGLPKLGQNITFSIEAIGHGTVAQ